eukprot:GHRR01000950.1.p1 GENE.GHRR01000950.1~~GHRR01000950.1.p1  ORF type:complete len:733 (+),score=338.67 GHRR01000950.1:205-2403(+)
MVTSSGTSVEFLDRPHFPAGLRVLVLDHDSSKAQTCRLLQDQMYDVKEAAGAAAALSVLQASSSSVDIVLADAAFLGNLDCSRAAHDLFMAAGSTPVVLMGDQCSPAQVLAAVKQGAADFLERPLSELKLRNLWQHTVRRMMSEGESRSGQSTPKAQQVSSPGTLQQQQQHCTAVAVATTALQQQQQTPAGTMWEGDTCKQQDAEQQSLLATVQLGPFTLEEQGLLTVDHLQGLSLPPLVPSQLTFDPDMIFLDLDGPVPANEPRLDDILAPCTPSDSLTADNKLAATAACCSSDQHSNTDALFSAELESCADTTSSLAAGGSASGRSGLQNHPCFGSIPSFNSVEASPASKAATGVPAAVAAVPATALPGTSSMFPMAMPCCPFLPPYPAATSAAYWAAPTGTKGMVWGMPLHTVATVPGLAVAGKGAAISKAVFSKSSALKGSSGDSSPGSSEKTAVAPNSQAASVAVVKPAAAASAANTQAAGTTAAATGAHATASVAASAAVCTAAPTAASAAAPPVNSAAVVKPVLPPMCWPLPMMLPTATTTTAVTAAATPQGRLYSVPMLPGPMCYGFMPNMPGAPGFPSMYPMGCMAPMPMGLTGMLGMPPAMPPMQGMWPMAQFVPGAATPAAAATPPKVAPVLPSAAAAMAGSGNGNTVTGTADEEVATAAAAPGATAVHAGALPSGAATTAGGVSNGQVSIGQHKAAATGLLPTNLLFGGAALAVPNKPAC